jgi:DNA transposition AAA+ family ATPase
MTTTTTTTAETAELGLEKREAAEVDRRGDQVINISGDEMTQATAEYPEEHRAQVRWLFAWVKSRGWSYKKAQAETTLSTTTLYRIWKGKYVDPTTGQGVRLDGVCETISRFRELAEARAMEQESGFVETSVWRRVDKICQEALIMQSFAFIYGESQIGKTAALREHARRNNHGQTIYVLMPASGGVQAMMKTIAAACHISARTSFEQLRARVERFFDHTKLLIIDEVHEVFLSYQKGSMLKCLAVLRQLQERTGCGIVLCGTNAFRSEIERGEFTQALKQLKKRGIWELQLEDSPSWEDLKCFWKSHRLGEPTGEVAQLVRWMGQEMGLGKFTRFLARAAMLAKSKGRKFGWDDFVSIVRISERMRKIEKNN